MRQIWLSLLLTFFLVSSAFSGELFLRSEQVNNGECPASIRRFTLPSRTGWNPNGERRSLPQETIIANHSGFT